MSRGSRFGPLGKKLVMLGNAQHRALRLRTVELIDASTAMARRSMFDEISLGLEPSGWLREAPDLIKVIADSALVTPLGRKLP
jgi:hypothetical protein